MNLICAFCLSAILDCPVFCSPSVPVQVFPRDSRDTVHYRAVRAACTPGLLRRKSGSGLGKENFSCELPHKFAAGRAMALSFRWPFSMFDHSADDGLQNLRDALEKAEEAVSSSSSDTEEERERKEEILEGRGKGASQVSSKSPENSADLWELC